MAPNRYSESTLTIVKRRRHRSLYTLKPCALYHHQLIEAVLNILDGPVLLKQGKPVKRRPTAADQFYKEHQADYDARERNPEKTHRGVDAHHTAYPKLIDELERRRSVAKARPIYTDTPKYSASYENKSKNSDKRDNLTRKPSRVSKYINPRRNYSKKSILLKPGSEYQASSRHLGIPSERPIRISSPVVSKHSSYDNMSQKYPRSSRPSQTSFRSFKSSPQQEPMV